MKKFFKKIGRGFKKLGKGIAKVLNSKVGRVIGMVTLAIGIGSLFQTLANAGSGAVAPTVLVEGAGTTGAATKEVVAGEAGKKIVAEKIVKEGAKTTVNNTKDLIKVSGELSEKTAIDLAKNNGSMTKVAEKTVGDVAAGADAGAETTSVIQSAANERGADVFKNEFYKSNDWAAEKVLTASEQQATDAFIYSKQPVREFGQNLKNPDFRAEYDQLAKQYPTLQQSSNVKGVQEFTSFGEAFKAGDNLLSSTGNVLERGLTMDLGTISKGSVTGYAGSIPAYSTATTAASILAPTKPEPIVRPNIYAGSQLSAIQSQNQNTLYSSAPSTTFDFNTKIQTGQNPMDIVSGIRQKAGLSSVYGPLYNLGVS